MERIPTDDQRDFKKHINGTVMFGCGKSKTEHFVMNENGTLLMY